MNESRLNSRAKTSNEKWPKMWCNEFKKESGDITKKICFSDHLNWSLNDKSQSLSKIVIEIATENE